MKKLFLLCVLLLTLTACAAPKANGTLADSVPFPAYSNLMEESTKKEVAKRLTAAKIPKERVRGFLEWVTDFNSMEAYRLSPGFQQMQGGTVTYDALTAAIEKRWAEKQGNYEDLMCRTVAFYLAEGLITGPVKQPEEINFADKAVIEGNPHIAWSDEIQSKYYTLFNPVKIEQAFRVEQKAEAIAQYWAEAFPIESTTELVKLVMKKIFRSCL